MTGVQTCALPISVLAEATRVDCDLVLNPVYSEEETAASARKLLAAIRVTCERIQDQISLIGEQIQNQADAFLFEPVLATAVRGAAKSRIQFCGWRIWTTKTRMLYMMQKTIS